MADPAALAFLEKVELRGEGDLDTIRALLLEALAEVRGRQPGAPGDSPRARRGPLGRSQLPAAVSALQDDAGLQLSQEERGAAAVSAACRPTRVACLVCWSSCSHSQPAGFWGLFPDDTII